MAPLYGNLQMGTVFGSTIGCQSSWGATVELNFEPYLGRESLNMEQPRGANGLDRVYLQNCALQICDGLQ